VTPRERIRRLSGPEIELTVHLYKSGAAATPVRVIATAIKTAMTLRKLGLAHAWSRYSEGRGSDGPFFTLTSAGVYRAEELYLSRQQGRGPSTISQSSTAHSASQPSLFNPGDDHERS
jgi:hypothetical protein